MTIQIHTPARHTPPLPRSQQQERERHLAPSSSYIEDRHSAAQCGEEEQQTPGVRLVITSWVTEVAAALKLQDETLHLAVQLMDRLLSTMQARAWHMRVERLCQALRPSA